MVFKKRFQEVGGRRLGYIEAGQGSPIILLHGNPTSSYLWRNIVPALADCGRVIAPDLIGQGDSEKLPTSDGPNRYTFQIAYQYLDGLLHQLDATTNIVLVGHDWGSALAFHWAKNHPSNVRGLSYMEALVSPIGWNDWPELARDIFRDFRSNKGENLILERNLFIEVVLPNAIIRELNEYEMNCYRAAFIQPDDRQPMLNWPRQIPIDGEPAEMVALVSEYGRWLEESDFLPKLFINADPGSILVGRQREYCRAWPNQIEVTVSGKHFIQEDSPIEIGQAIVSWLGTLD
ncbi:MAG: haloalkane dehalogenase [Acidiferrobacteraceae bacterium]|nr:haloalkane dehalogenase [Acidiferrobacteraceae bacterium]|tara:strand:+ start:1531 stop:2400 length:870 start_codon:yes stop_codon:yes gene_type:complete